MRNIFINLSIVCALLFSVGCGKNGIVPVSGSSANAQLIVGTYTADVVEGSFDNANWHNYTLTGTRNVVTINANNTYTSATLTLATGVTSDVLTGTWALAADGKTISFQWGTGTGTGSNQPFTIVSLTATTMVVLFSDHNIHTPYSSAYYPYNRVTYTRS